MPLHVVVGGHSGHTLDGDALQYAWPPSLPRQRPCSHESPGAHASLHWPQWAAVTFASTQALPQQMPLSPPASGHGLPVFAGPQEGIAAQVPFAQNCPAAHALPHCPQCCSEVARDTQSGPPQQPPHAAVEPQRSSRLEPPPHAVRTHDEPVEQVVPAGQLWLQSMRKPASGRRHCRFTHAAPVGHVAPHSPQFAGSLKMSSFLQAPPQHWPAPPSPSPQSAPTFAALQFAAPVTHWLPSQICPAPQARPHWPQFATVLSATQAPPQHEPRPPEAVAH